MLQINAADLAAGNRFTFWQPQFDLICSDLSSLKLARAVAASSAVPVLFNAITLKNYAGTCGYEPPASLLEAARDRTTSRRRYFNAKVALSYLDVERRRYIHLVDGGIADNVGLRGPLDEVMLAGGIFERMRQLGVGRPRHIAVVVVDSQVNPEPPFSRSPASPTLQAMINAVTGVQVNRYTFETIEMMRERMGTWAEELGPGPDGRRVQTHLVEVAFDYLEDPDARAYFNELPTSFDLEDEAVRRLIDAGRTLLRESGSYREFTESLGGDRPSP